MFLACCLVLVMFLLVIFGSCMLCWFMVFFFFKQKTAYEMRISDWSSDVCSSDLPRARPVDVVIHIGARRAAVGPGEIEFGAFARGAAAAARADGGDRKSVV